MKRVVAVLTVFFLICVAVGFHVVKTYKFTDEVQHISDVVYDGFDNRDWAAMREALADILSLWEKNRLWACSTLSTREVDEMEISLKQSIAYAESEFEEGFIGEFKMFTVMIEHLPKQEGPSIYELL